MSGPKKNISAMIAVGVSLLIWFGSALLFQNWVWATHLIRVLIVGIWMYAILSYRGRSN
jgi:hypothetical protein